ncbi:MAG: hypothetical protein KA715_04710 [Xanthomonadaceae bacterium]|nr:hypothetical protein [Xanthomonadaceae bacterium]
MYSRTLLFSSLLFGANAFGLGQVEFNAVSFLRNSVDRTTTISYLSLGPKLESSGSWMDSVLDLKAIAFLAQNSSFTAEAPQAYISTNKKWSGLHQFALGRKWMSWSMLDDRWRMGLYNPRFTWDPIYPETIGLTGGFYSYESKYVSFVAYGSPIAIPERGASLSVENGQLISAQPLMKPMPNLITGIIGNSQTPINYSIQMPPTSQMIFRPNGMASLKVRTDNGLWATGNYGYLPIHQADIFLDATLSASTSRIDAKIMPQFHMQELMGLEAGYQADVFSLWFSAQRQTPNVASIADSTTIRNSIGPASLIATGADFHLMNKNLTLTTTVLTVDETTTPVSGAFAVSLPSRFWYKRAFQIGAQYGNPDSKFTYTANWINDIEQVSQLISVDVGFRPYINKAGTLSSLTVSLGTDFFTSSTGAGTIGQFVGNDRVRGRIAYAF